MSGRSYSGRGHGGRGRGGRGKGKQGGRGSFNNNKNKQIYKFSPHGTGKGQQTHVYDSVKKVIVGYVQRTYEYGGDIAMCLEEVKKIDMSIQIADVFTKDLPPAAFRKPRKLLVGWQTSSM